MDKHKRQRIREKLADYAHEAWSGWMKHLFDLSKITYTRNYQSDELTPEGVLLIPDALVKRWQRQMTTSYNELSDAEKDSDRKEADKILAILEDHKL
jgi:hypothetical protein